MLGVLCNISAVDVVLPSVEAVILHEEQIDLTEGVNSPVVCTQRTVNSDADVAVTLDETSMLSSCFDVKELEWFISLTGMFSRSNYCNVDDDSTFSLVSSSPRIAFDAQSCKGQHMWIDTPFNKLEKYLAHYVAGKKEQPATTSAVIIVPRWLGGSHWRRHLAGMYLIKEWPALTPLKWVPGEGKGCHPRPAAPCPYVLQAWFDPKV